MEAAMAGNNGGPKFLMHLRWVASEYVALGELRRLFGCATLTGAVRECVRRQALEAGVWAVSADRQRALTDREDSPVVQVVS